MAQQTQRPARGRGRDSRATANTARGRNSRNGASSSPKATRSRSGSNRANSNRAKSTAARTPSSNRAKSTAARTRSTTRQASQRASSTISAPNGFDLKSAAVPVATAAFGAAAGILGGAALGRKTKPSRKLLGVSVPEVGGGAEKLGRQVGEAGRQFARLANEVRAAREQAQKVAKALS